jgi:multiple sugar transport system ATP-binding protein
VLIDAKSVREVPPQERDVAMVFQGFALYPHMTVRQILSFPLKMRKTPKSDRARIVEETASLLSIGHLLDRRPGELSGGEQQRAAMGRAIVRKPRLFLFDEPLSNLDAALRAELRVELKKLLARLGTTALYVTHDQTEAMTLSDRIALLNTGHLEQVDSPRTMYESPSSTFVAQFFGTPPMNLLPVEREGDRVSLGGVSVAAPRDSREPLTVGFRPEHVELDRELGASSDLGGQARVTLVEPLGAETHVELEVGQSLIKARLAGLTAPETSSQVRFRVAEDHLTWFNRDSGRAL